MRQPRSPPLERVWTFDLYRQILMPRIVPKPAVCLSAGRQQPPRTVRHAGLAHTPQRHHDGKSDRIASVPNKQPLCPHGAPLAARRLAASFSPAAGRPSRDIPSADVSRRAAGKERKCPFPAGSLMGGTCQCANTLIQAEPLSLG
jgi:hypothetical protein